MKRFAALLVSIFLVAPAIAQSQTTGPIATADHIALNVADADASATFYKRAFGFREVETQLPDTKWLSMGNGMTLHLIGGRTAMVAPDRVVHFALRTADLTKSISYFDENSISWSDFNGKPRNIQTRFDGVRQIFIQDPDGYWIEVSDVRGKLEG